MAWTEKSKIPTTFQRSRIMTVDGRQILAGSDEDKVLIYQTYETLWSGKTKTAGNWSNKSKLSGSWTNKTKIPA